MDLALENEFFAFSRHMIADATAAGRYDVAHNRAAALRCLALFLGKDHLPIDELSPSIMSQFKSWLVGQGRKESTARLYINQVNGMYNVAVKSGLAPKVRLLDGIKAAMPSRQRRKLLTPDELHRMRCADLSDSRPMSFARDMFMFSIYARGISFTDMAYIKKSDVHGSTLTYTSQATGHPLVTVQWDAAMQAIADSYPSVTDYLLPIIKSTDDARAHRDVKQVRENIVNAFKQIATRCHLSVVPSMYMVKDIYQRAIDSVSVSRII